MLTNEESAAVTEIGYTDEIPVLEKIAPWAAPGERRAAQDRADCLIAGRLERVLLAFKILLDVKLVGTEADVGVTKFNERTKDLREWAYAGPSAIVSHLSSTQRHAVAENFWTYHLIMLDRQVIGGCERIEREMSLVNVSISSGASLLEVRDRREGIQRLVDLVSDLEKALPLKEGQSIVNRPKSRASLKERLSAYDVCIEGRIGYGLSQCEEKYWIFVQDGDRPWWRRNDPGFNQRWAI